MSARYGTLYERMDRETIPEPNSGCWLFCGPCDDAGYGRIRVGKKKNRVHRLGFERCIGPIPEGMDVLHRCDVPACWNPDHLFLGTIADNVADKTAKGRQARGEGAAAAKLTDEQVSAIRASDKTQRQLAQDYGVCSHNTIGRIKRLERWRHVQER
jgi:Autographiviridae endonuclease